MAYSGYDIYNLLRSPGDSSSIDSAGQSCGKLSNIHNTVADKLTDGQTALNSFWKGQAADAGSAGLGPMVATSRTAAQNMTMMQQHLSEQSAAFNYAKNNVVEVSTSRPDDDKLTDYLSLGASDDEKAAAEFDDKTKKNVAVYQDYDQNSAPRTQTMPMDYPAAHDPSVSSGGFTPDPQVPGSGLSSGPHVSGSGGHSSAHSSGGSHSYSGGGPSTYTVPPGAENVPAPPPPGSSHGATPPSVPAPNDGTRTSSSWADPVSGQNPGGVAPWQNGPGSSSNPSGGNGSALGGGAGVGGVGLPGGFGGASGGSAGGRSAGGGFGSGGSGAAGRGLGAGVGTGSGTPGEGAGRPGMGTAGAAGAKGQSGMGGMGAGGAGKGKGGEDEEHQRKILLPEEDPDSLFGGYDGDRPTPPVIGA
ncbi:hypothetical protein [Amycolatopsis saalfeldensis]|nr:hypothetical protein [Amycolatopsis saalfeldensis]